MMFWRNALVPIPTNAILVIRHLASAILSLACLGFAPARSTVLQADQTIHCDWRTTFAGSVSEGRRFEHAFGSRFLFVLVPTPNAPPNPYGWTIEIFLRKDAHTEDPRTELSEAATEPHHSSNPRYIERDYGQSLDEVIGWSPRDFDFYTDAQTNERAQQWLYDDNHAATQPAGDLPTPRGHGELRYRDLVLSGVGEDRHISRLSFEVTLCLD